MFPTVIAAHRTSCAVRTWGSRRDCGKTDTKTTDLSLRTSRISLQYGINWGLSVTLLESFFRSLQIITVVAVLDCNSAGSSFCQEPTAEVVLLGEDSRVLETIQLASRGDKNISMLPNHRLQLSSIVQCRPGREVLGGLAAWHGGVVGPVRLPWRFAALNRCKTNKSVVLCYCKGAPAQNGNFCIPARRAGQHAVAPESCGPKLPGAGLGGELPNLAERAHRWRWYGPMAAGAENRTVQRLDGAPVQSPRWGQPCTGQAKVRVAGTGMPNHSSGSRAATPS